MTCVHTESLSLSAHPLTEKKLHHRMLTNKTSFIAEGGQLLDLGRRIISLDGKSHLEHFSAVKECPVVDN